MASDDVRRLINILDRSGFGEIGGEILAQINGGRIETDAAEKDRPDPDEADERPPKRLPFAPEEQLAEAVRLLRLRLVEPARRLAEAEREAADLADRQQVRIAFLDDEGADIVGDVGRAAPGDETVALKLDALLSQLLAPADGAGA